MKIAEAKKDLLRWKERGMQLWMDTEPVRTQQFRVPDSPAPGQHPHDLVGRLSVVVLLQCQVYLPASFDVMSRVDSGIQGWHVEHGLFAPLLPQLIQFALKNL